MKMIYKQLVTLVKATNLRAIWCKLTAPILKWTHLTKRDILLIVLGHAIMCFAFINIHIPARVTEGGVIGLSIVLYKLTGISPGLWSLPLDMSMYFLGFIFLSKDFIGKAIFSTISFALVYTSLEAVGPFIPSLAAYPLIAAILGGMCIGVGCGLLVTRGCVAGGDDCYAMVMAKKTKLSMGWAYFIGDALILLLAWLTYMPLSHVFISFVTTTISSFIIGQFEVRLPQTKISQVQVQPITQAL